METEDTDGKSEYVYYTDIRYCIQSSFPSVSLLFSSFSSLTGAHPCPALRLLLWCGHIPLLKKGE